MILDAIKSVAGLGDKALSLIPDENQRRRLDHELRIAVMQAERAAIEMQARIVEEHGKSEGLFKSGYRPAAAWVCVAGLALAVAMSVVSWALRELGWQPVGQPELEWLWPLLIPLLGIGAYRTAEKIGGVAGDPVVMARRQSAQRGIDSRIAAAERRVSEVEADQLAKGVY